MPLTETQELSSASVGEFGHISVRIDRVIYDGTVEVARLPHRHVIAPGADLSKEHARVQTIAKAAWSPDVVKLYRAMREASDEQIATANAALPQFGAQDLAPLNAISGEG